jgi:flagellar hook-basal body protein
LGGASNTLKVSYDYATQGFKFVDGTSTITLKSGSVSGSPIKNDVLGLTSTAVTLDEAGHYAAKVLPNGNTSLRLSAEQRFGMEMTYDSVNKTFSLRSGTTGDRSSLAVSSTNALGKTLLGLSDQAVSTSAIAKRGISSTPAVAVGTTPTVNISNNFAVDDTNNKFVVTVDGVKGTVVIPTGSDYSLASFMSKLQKGINALASNTDGSPVTVNGVKVSYDELNSRFVFTTGTASADSFIKISGSSNWGLDQVEAGRGTTSTWINPTQHKDVVGGALQPKFIDGEGKETTSGDGFSVLPAWSPLYLDKGELTFDTGGNLVSPEEGTQLETVYLAGGKGALTINIDYSASTQYSSPFAVLSQGQDGAPEGDLVGITIGNDGLVSASFSNGTQKSLAKILLVNFSSPVGLRQIGDSSFLASAASGKPILGTAGSAGFGTLRAGATERANVDLTQELVDLITAQRNFQANAKAIETSTTMTSAIINMRAG